MRVLSEVVRLNNEGKQVKCRDATPHVYKEIILLITLTHGKGVNHSHTHIHLNQHICSRWRQKTLFDRASAHSNEISFRLFVPIISDRTRAESVLICSPTPLPPASKLFASPTSTLKCTLRELHAPIHPPRKVSTNSYNNNTHTHTKKETNSGDYYTVCVSALFTFATLAQDIRRSPFGNRVAGHCCSVALQ